MIKNNSRCYSKRFISFAWDNKRKIEWVTQTFNFISKIFYITASNIYNLNDIYHADHNIQTGD